MHDGRVGPNDDGVPGLQGVVCMDQRPTTAYAEAGGGGREMGEGRQGRTVNPRGGLGVRRGWCLRERAYGWPSDAFMVNVKVNMGNPRWISDVLSGERGVTTAFRERMVIGRKAQSGSRPWMKQKGEGGQ